ncbi:tripartite motif-containing protein 15 [Neophocaena asiaeorientalis asiaeorientalis]|uniref:E3 ubiquitin-protein ligase TRIM15 n=2 Tax=Phocoenidae TaxID=9740 RepID=A0A341D073_NEOAA|nr:tripartite motif-containing protein 15 [Neophocaena asiaeorientalis asiaeorientalis]XP_032504218.1 tripartite motif-containing protein 15 [Phocoena sinus]
MPSTPSHKGAPCSECKGPLEDAVTATCGHTFCWHCLPPPSQMGAQPSGRVLLCPLCKEKKQTETLLVPVPLGPLEETYCEEHGEKIYFFCENDAKFLCVFCREGPSHQAHVVGLLHEAIQPYRDRLRSRLEALRMERDDVEDMKSRDDRKLQVLLTQIESKKQQVEAAFERLQQELGEYQHLLLARLTELEQQIWKERDEYISKLSEEVARLGAQVKELEEKCQQPASELLQDVRVNQSRYEMKTFVSPEAISPDLVEKIRDLHRKILTLPEMMRAFSENLVHHLETDTGVVTLDPQTASQGLVLSEDRKSVKYTRWKQNLPDSRLRFEGLPVVLGSPSFSSGRHRWQVEVQLGDGGGCTVGVVGEEVRRKGKQGLSAEEGVWAVILSHQQCWATTSPGTDLPLSEIPRLVGVSLDYEAGHLALLNAETQEPIFTFTASFSGKVYPFFAVWKKGSCLTLKG